MTSGRVCSLVLAFAALALAVPAAASAAITNVIPATADGDPNDEFRADNGLFFYATSDLKGGRVCIVSAEGDMEDLSCDSPAWGSPNTVVGIGTLFSIAEGGNLRIGTWRLLAETIPAGEDDKPEPTAISIPFTVGPCGADCGNAFDETLVLDFKTAAEQNYRAYFEACAAMVLGSAFKDLNGQFNDAISGKLLTDKLQEKLKLEKKWDFGSGSVTVAVGLGGISAGFAFVSPEDVIRTGEKKALEILKTLTCTLGATYADINNDPPDPAYATVEQPTARDVVALGDPKTDALARTEDDELGLGLAELTALERYSQAHTDGDLAGEHRQAAALAAFGYRLVDQSRATARSLRAYADMLDTKAEFADPLFQDDAERDAWQALYNRVRDDGFTSSERADLVNLGYDDAAIANAREQFDEDFSSIPPGETFQAGVRHVADAVDANAAAMDAFARDAERVAGGTDAPPDAAFSSTPGAGARTLHFTDETPAGDGDTPTTIHWDFGDGSTAEGPQADHTYGADGEYDVTLRVCDLYACADATKTIELGAPRAIVIRVETTPAESSITGTAFPFTAGSLGTFQLRSGQSKRFEPGRGAFVIQQAFVPGYDLRDLTCDDASASVSLPDRGVTIQPPPNTTVTCTFRDDRYGKLTIAKAVAGAPGGPFTFTADDPFGSFELNAGDSISAVVKPGSYTVTEASRDGFDLTDIACDDGSATSLDAHQATVSVAPAEIVRCTFTSAPQSAVGSPPVAADDEVEGDEDTSIGFNPLQNDADPDGDQLTILSAAATPAGGLFCDSGACSYTPPRDFNGVAHVRYTASDGALIDDATVTVHVAPVDDAPVGAADAAATGTGRPVSIDVVANDRDADGDAVTATLAGDPASGTATCAARTCTYTPAAGFSGTDSFTYEPTAAGAAGVPVEVRVEVAPGPVAHAHADNTFGRAPLGVSFDANGSGGVDPTYRWDFGDGTTANGPVTSHWFTDPGSYVVRLDVTDKDGATASDTVTVDVDATGVSQLPLCEDLTPLCPGFEAQTDVQLFRVPGDGDVEVEFRRIATFGVLPNLLAVARVDDATGAVDGLRPGDIGYRGAVLERARQALGPLGEPHEFTFQGGDYLVLIDSIGSLDDARTARTEAYASLTAFNEDGVDHLLAFRRADGAFTQFGFEDLFGGGDRDFDDVVFQVSPGLRTVPELAAAIRAATPQLRPGAGGSFTLSLTSTRTTPVSLHAFTAELPDGFSYLPGTTTGATTADPAVDGHLLRWAVDLVLPALATRELTFGVRAALRSGAYAATGGADAGGFPILPAEPASIDVIDRRPTASDVTAETGAGAPVQLTLSGADEDGQPLQFAPADQPAHGHLGAVSGDHVTYTPDAGFAGADAFHFTASDGELDSTPAAARITVHAVPPAPTPSPTPSPAPQPTPTPTPGGGTPAPTVGQLVSLPSTRRCVSRRSFRIRLRRADGVKIVSAEVRVNGRRVTIARGKRLTAPVDLRGLPKGRFTVTVILTDSRGRRYRDDRHYHTCVARKRKR